MPFIRRPRLSNNFLNLNLPRCDLFERNNQMSDMLFIRLFNTHRDDCTDFFKDILVFPTNKNVDRYTYSVAFLQRVFYCSFKWSSERFTHARETSVTRNLDIKLLIHLSVLLYKYNSHYWKPFVCFGQYFIFTIGFDQTAPKMSARCCVRERLKAESHTIPSVSCILSLIFNICAWPTGSRTLLSCLQSTWINIHLHPKGNRLIKRETPGMKRNPTFCFIWLHVYRIKCLICRAW